MDYRTFEETAANRAGIKPEEATPVIQATLQTLAERITRGEAEDLASQLPKQMKEWLAKDREHADRFGLDEFIRKVSERASIPPDEARKDVRAVFKTLHDAVTGGEFRHVMSQLPREFQQLAE
jgi:uncharacterized protein (DUF2267 family)